MQQTGNVEDCRCNKLPSVSILLLVGLTLLALGTAVMGIGEALTLSRLSPAARPGCERVTARLS
jgi:hypothetical protein